MRDAILQNLVRQLQVLPGIGERSARRMVQHLLQSKRDQAASLGHSLIDAMAKVSECTLCRNYTTQPICSLCQDDRRLTSLLCVVAHSSDVDAMEAAGFEGIYFVLHGIFSPMHGVGSEQLALDKLVQELRNRGVDEVVLALPATVEGEATCHLIIECCKQVSYNIRVTRLAQGVPIGSALSHVDCNTLAQAFNARA